MIFKSIKWRLQIWYGLILVAVLAGLGVAAFQLERGRVFRDVDDALARRVNALALALHPRGFRPGGRPLGALPPGGGPPPNGPVFEPKPQRRPSPGEFHLPIQDAGLFDPGDPNRFYFIIQLPDGRELARSTNAPVMDAIGDNRPSAGNDTFVRRPGDLFRPVVVQTLGKFRQMRRTLPSGEVIQVGCLVTPELKEIRLAALRLAAVGAVILLLGLAGGWWIASHAIRPIQEISAAAVKISAGDLSQRINVAETESELGRLAAVLNATFARLETAFAQQRQFTADAAHELRTPVTVMLTQAQTALNRERQAAEYRETLEACQRTTQRMRRLIESLLELARLDAGQEFLKRTRLDLSLVAAGCVESLKPLADERGVKMNSDLPPLEVAGDSGRLAQVITNLLTNAIQYNRVGGEVRMTTAREKDLAVLTVSDTGPGIPAGDLPRVFERFYRADKSHAGPNAGLGLAISKSIVAAHGGTIEVASQTGVGTVFTVRLPLSCERLRNGNL